MHVYAVYRILTSDSQLYIGIEDMPTATTFCCSAIRNLPLSEQQHHPLSRRLPPSLQPSPVGFRSLSFLLILRGGTPSAPELHDTQAIHLYIRHNYMAPVVNLCQGVIFTHTIVSGAMYVIPERYY